MNPGLFDPKNSINKFKLIEMNETPFYLSCKNCKQIPELILKNKENIFIFCSKCNISENEKIQNIVNYSSEWITNEIIKYCNMKHEDKIFSIIYCRTCNLFLCEECFNQHKNKNENHEYIELYKLKINFCYFHNEKLSYYCFDCNEEICEKCINDEHKVHKTEKLDIINEKNTNLEKFEKFLENAENIKKSKYLRVNQNILYLDNYKIEDKESEEELKKTIKTNLKIFYDDLKVGQNLLFFAKILFISCEKLKEYKDIRRKQYETLFQIISQYFETGKVEEFKTLIDNEKNKFITYSNKVSNEEINVLKNSIKDIFEPNNRIISDFEKKKDFIQKNIEYSSILKRFITREKINNPDNYIDIDKTLNDIDNINKHINSNEKEFVLSLIGKCIENNGTQINISKKIDEKLINIELSSIQSLFTLGNQKKYEIHFDFGEEKNKKILNDPKEKELFIEKYKKIISEKLKINEENIIFTDIHHGCVGTHLSIINQTKKDKDIINELKKDIDCIQKIDEKPMLEALQISPQILDPLGDRNKGWGINERRGGEKYIPPLNGWYGIGLNVKNKYDNGNNAWLGYKNKKGEFCIAYLGLNNFLNDKNKIIEDLNKFSIDINSMMIEKLYQNEIDLKQNKGFWNIFFENDIKCGDGICVFQNPDYAENSAGIIDILGYRIKIILMCRVNPNKIRQPKRFQYCWILNPTPDEIRPYRILIKKIPISPLTISANNSIITSTSPIDYIISSIKSNDFIFYKLKNDNKYLNISKINGQQLNNDFFTLRFYTSNYYKYINNYLREKNIENFSEEQLQSWICCLQVALRNNIGVKDDSIVYRGIKYSKFPSDIGIGSKFYFREFISTSLSEKEAKGFADNKKKEGTIMIITIKNNGTNGHLNYCYDVSEISCIPTEKEILLSSHCYFSVTNLERNKNYKYDYVYLTCEGYLLD